MHVSKLTAEQLEKLTKSLADQGLLVTAGWTACAHLLTNESTPAKTEEKLRQAYFAGAQHIFACMTTMVDDGDEITDADMHRMQLLQIEMQAWAEQQKKAQN